MDLTTSDIPPELANPLEANKNELCTSSNNTVLMLLHDALGLDKNHRKGNGLATLAGRWSKEEVRKLELRSAYFF